ncbi:RICIN domain-containing protein [Streptomyces longwoodensis]|uniref:RICIN domain-containing protein n=1 Tax=Streptomyces longwoodensis TaxID=68231 RepID=UPI0030E2B8BA|nr:RICIN domain-containing protein [Streptomyces longwoodensis]
MFTSRTRTAVITGTLTLTAALLGAAPAGATPTGALDPVAAQTVPTAGVSVVNTYNNRCLTAMGTFSGASAQLWDCTGEARQKWTVNWVYTPIGAYYELRNSASGLCLDADLNTIGSNGTRAQVWECLGTVQTNQHWRFEPATNQADVYRLRTQYNGRCLDGQYQQLGGNGGRVQLWDCYGDGQVNQLWKVA